MSELVMRREPWMDTAACRRHDPDLWHADGYGAKWMTLQAKRICRTECAHALECLTHALAAEGDGPRWGVYGGLDADERAAIAKGRK